MKLTIDIDDNELRELIIQGIRESDILRDAVQTMVAEVSAEKLGRGIDRSLYSRDIADEVFGLSVRTVNCLRSQLVNRLQDLRCYTRNYLMRCRNMGNKCMMELDNLANRYGIVFGSEPARWTGQTDSSGRLLDSYGRPDMCGLIYNKPILARQAAERMNREIDKYEE